jgi:hypothetical protein
MADIKAFIKKWNGRTLQDDGCYVSKEFHSFQVAFMNAMRKVANSLGAELVNHSYGHYDMSGFIKRGDRYVYFSYDNTCNWGGRNYVALTRDNSYRGCCCPLLIRVAKDAKDYRGLENNFAPFSECEELIEKLLNESRR